MPANSTGVCRSDRRRTIPAKALQGTAGAMPIRMSLAPRSTITASVPSGRDQSGRGSPRDAVPPGTPALTTSASRPASLSARSSFAGKAASAGSPKPAVRESPSATTRTVRSVAASEHAQVNANTSASTGAAKRWTRARAPSYDERCAERIAVESGDERRNMQDTSRSGWADAAIALSGVNLSLGRAAARVHILKDIDLHIGRGEALGLIGPSGSGKSTLLMVTAGLERADSGSVVVAGAPLGSMDEDALARFRARNIGIVFQSFHLIPTMTALENVAVPLELAGIEDADERAAREL